MCKFFINLSKFFKSLWEYIFAECPPPTEILGLFHWAPQFFFSSYAHDANSELFCSAELTSIAIVFSFKTISDYWIPATLLTMLCLLTVTQFNPNSQVWADFQRGAVAKVPGIVRGKDLWTGRFSREGQKFKLVTKKNT